MNMHAPVKPRGRGGKAKSRTGGMRYRPMMMTPAEAARLLATADKADFGTKVFRDKVARYAAVMRERMWSANGETVVVGVSGKLLDGRARLQACVDSGEEFPTILVTDVEDEAYVSIDAHSRRSATDVLAIDEVEHARTVSSAWQAIASYLNAPRRDRWRYQGSTAIGTSEISLLTEIFREDIDISASFVTGLKLGKAFPATVGVACHFLASKADPELANAFFRDYAASAGKGESPPALLRRRLESEGANTTFTYRMATFSKAWEAYATKREASFESIDFKGPVERKGGLGQEAFPPIHGVDPDLRLDFGRLRLSALKGVPTRGYTLAAFDGVTVDEVRMTPEKCEEFLLRNGPRGRNRTVRAGHVLDLGRMMRDGRWYANGKTIKRTSEGDLIDGQHRCIAGRDSGVGFVSLVVEGLDPSCFVTLDLGERKTLGARLRAGGDRNGKQVNSVCTTLWRLAENKVGGEPPAVEAKRIYEHDREAIDRSVAYVRRNGMSRTLDVSIAGALHRAFSLYDADMADAFMLDIAVGAELKTTNPVLRLRDELKHKGGTLDTPAKRTRAVIRTWNAYVTGMHPRKLRFLEDGERNYPDIAIPTKDKDGKVAKGGAARRAG